jgi:hypothetical protein
MTQKEFVAKVREHFEGNHRVIAHKDGTIQIRDGYYYRMGKDSDKWAAQVAKALPEAVVVDKGDHWANWPKESYFWVKIKLK